MITEGLIEKRRSQGLVGPLLKAFERVVVAAWLMRVVMVDASWWGDPLTDMTRLLIKHVMRCS